MKKLIVLITGVGGDIGQSIIKCLEDIKDSYDIDIYGCDIDPYAAGRKTCKKFFKVPKATETDYFDSIKTIVENERVNYIIPSTEPEIKFYDSQRKYFKDKGINLLINESNIINTFFDKYETVNFLKKNKLPYAKTSLIEDYKGDFGFPLILKQRSGYGAKGLMVVNDIEELDFYKKRLKDVIVQQLVGDTSQEYTTGVFSDGGKVYSVSFKRVLGYGSLTRFAQLIHSSEITTLVERIAKVADLKGSLNVQLRRTPSGYTPLEINPRLSSTVYIRHFFGFKDVKWWIDYFEGRPIDYQPKYKEGIAVKRVDDVFFDIK